MSSHTDKKEEFRKYLEKSNVLATLTEILTDLFEMESKPEDPARYVYQKLGESLEKSSKKNNVKPSNGSVPVSSETPDKDATMTDVPPTQPNAMATQQTEASVTPVVAVSTSPVNNVGSQPTYPVNATEPISETKQEPNVKPDIAMPAAIPANPTPPGDGAQASVAEGNGTTNATTATPASLPTTNSASVQ